MTAHKFTIAAFDLGSVSAVACNCEVRLGGQCDTWWDHWAITSKKAKRPERLAHFSLRANAMLLRARPEVVIFERPFCRGIAATRALWGYAGILEALAEKHGAACLDVLPSTIKQWATGSGKAGKDDMIAAAKVLGYTGDNEHEADAFCLLKYAERNVQNGA